MVSQTAERRRLADLVGAPGWRVRGGFKPRGKSRIQKATAERWKRLGYAEETVKGNHGCLVLTLQGQAFVKNKSVEDLAAERAARATEGRARMWWQE